MLCVLSACNVCTKSHAGIHNYRPHSKDEGRYCFHRCLSVNILRAGVTPCGRWGQVPPSQVQAGGGSPFPGRDRRYLHPRGYPPVSRMGYHPIWNWKGGTPHPTQSWEGGHPPAGSGKGYPPQSRSGPRTGGTPQPKQHSVYLLRGGWYTSCVHAGGLSCFMFETYTQFLEKNSQIVNLNQIHFLAKFIFPKTKKIPIPLFPQLLVNSAPENSALQCTSCHNYLFHGFYNNLATSYLFWKLKFII